jgi:hypothetical protein
MAGQQVAQLVQGEFFAAVVAEQEHRNSIRLGLQALMEGRFTRNEQVAIFIASCGDEASTAPANDADFICGSSSFADNQNGIDG